MLFVSLYALLLLANIFLSSCYVCDNWTFFGTLSFEYVTDLLKLHKCVRNIVKNIYGVSTIWSFMVRILLKFIRF